MHSPSNLWLPPVLVDVESSQPPQFVLLVKDQEQRRRTRPFQLENRVKCTCRKPVPPVSPSSPTQRENHQASLPETVGVESG